MVVSEIEGDAVLFFREGAPPRLDEIMRQTKRTFTAFHQHLRLIERDRVCQCGACSTAHRLTLKFIAHYGEISEVNVGNRKNLMGSDVILAHRLLKAGIEDREHLLCSADYFASAESDVSTEPWAEFENHCEQIENFGDVNLKYTSLANLHHEIEDVQHRHGNKYDGEPLIALEIKAAHNLVYELLTDTKKKTNYIKGLKRVVNAPPINRIHTTHTCEFGGFDLDFETEASGEKDNSLYYSERMKISTDVQFITQYKISDREGKTLLEAAIHRAEYQQRITGWLKIFSKLKSVILLIVYKFRMKGNVIRFKEYCESVQNREEGRD